MAGDCDDAQRIPCKAQAWHCHRQLTAEIPDKWPVATERWIVRSNRLAAMEGSLLNRTTVAATVCPMQAGQEQVGRHSRRQGQSSASRARPALPELRRIEPPPPATSVFGMNGTLLFGRAPRRRSPEPSLPGPVPPPAFDRPRHAPNRRREPARPEQCRCARCRWPHRRPRPCEPRRCSS